MLFDNVSVLSLKILIATQKFIVISFLFSRHGTTDGVDQCRCLMGRMECERNNSQSGDRKVATK